MEHNASSHADSSSKDQQNPATLHQSSQTPSYFFKILFNIILHSTPKDMVLT